MAFLALSSFVCMFCYLSMPVCECCESTIMTAYLPFDRWQLDVSTQQAQLVEEQLTQQLTHGWTDKESCRMFLDGILKSCRDTKLHLSSQLVASTAAYLAQHKLWGSLDDLLRAQALPSLTMCPGLVLAIVEGGHFSLLSSILPKVVFRLCESIQ